jgi:hypothetical protein
MIGLVKVVTALFFIFLLLLGGRLLGAVKTTGDVEGGATVDQTDMRGLVTA